MQLPLFAFSENFPQLLNYNVPVSGGVVVGGAAPNSFVWTTYEGISGGAVVGGTAPVSFVDVQIYTITPSGGVVVGGVAPVSVVFPVTYTHAPYGGVVVGGAAAVSDLICWVPTGGVRVGGTAPVSVVQVLNFTHVPSGGVVAGKCATLVALMTPVNAAFSTAATGGVLPAATYYYRVSAINALGETLASVETSQATTGTTSTVTVNWNAVPGAVEYKVYGRVTGAQQLIARVAGVLSYIDTGSITPSGALPTANTTAGEVCGAVIREYIPFFPTGGVVVGGAAGVSTLFVSIHTVTPTGGVVVGGVALQAGVSVFVPSGGVVIGGTVTPAQAFIITPSGGAVVGGAAPQAWASKFIPSGGVVVGGVAPNSTYVAFFAPSGGVVVGGTALAYMLPSGVVVTTANPYGFPYPGWAINYETYAPSRYLGLPANSICEFLGKTYVANDGGIYSVEGEDDDGAEIRASLTFPRTDFATSVDKRLEAAYIGVKTTGAMKLRLAAGGRSARYDLVSSTSAETKGARVTPGKGLVGRYWDARLDNIDGCAFEVADAEFVPKRGTRHGA